MNFQSPNPMQNRFQMQAPMSTPTPFSMAANPASQAPFAPQSGMPTATAQAMQGFGRGNDSMLVHMSPREVGGLQALARANGGQLTRNPQTGLPEAGFLENILPALAGTLLTVVSGGTLSPLMSGAIVGGATGLATGDINKGLMAGLGAFGGAGIGEALSSTGTAALGATDAASSALSGAGAAPITLGGTPAMQQAAQQAVTQLAPGAAAGANPFAASLAQAPVTAPTFNAGLAGAGATSPAEAIAANVSPATVNWAAPGMYSTEAMKAGISDLTAKGGLDRFMGAFPGGKLGMLAGGTGIMSAFQPEYKEPEKSTDSEYEGPYQAAPREVSYPSMDRILSDSSEYNFFTPTNPYPGYVKAPTFADGGDVNAVEPVTTATTPTTTINIAPTDYKHGMQSEFDYGFKPYAADVLDGLSSKGGHLSGKGGSSGGSRGGRGWSSGDIGGSGMGPDYGVYASPEMLGRISNIISLGYNPVDRSFFNSYSDSGFGSGSGGGFGGSSYGDSNSFGGGYGGSFGSSFGGYSDGSIGYGGDGGFGGFGGGSDGFGGGDAFGGWASGGLASLNSFAQGGRFLQGAGDGVSDSIKATIGGSQPARLADGEFVVDARTVSELGNGSSKAGAKKLYAMMDRVQNARKKAGRGKDSNADKYLPA